MAAWPTRRMDELCEITSSKRIFAADYVSEGVPFYRGREITEKYKGNLDVSTELFITEEKFQEIERKFGAPRQGDLLLTSVGTLGSVYVVKPGDRFYFKDGNLTWFRHFKELDSQFLYYWIGSPQGKAELQKCTIGSSQSAFTIVLLKGMEIELPPISIQRRIAGILSAYDELIENSQRRIKILESMARALYREWFVHFRFPGHESVSRVASPLGEIPQGWEVRKLESLMTGHIGGGWGKDVPDDDHTEPAWVIRGTDIPDARCAQVSGVPHRFHTTSNLRSRRLLQSDILFEVSGGSKGQPVGRTLLLTPQLMSAFDGDVICASFCKRITPDASSYGSELLYLSFLEGYESGEIEQFQVQSTGISNFKWTEYIAKTNRVVPPEPLRSTFRAHVVQFFAEVATLGLQIQNLRRTRDLLLPRLLSGQIDVRELSDDSEESSSHAQPQERVHESIYPSAMVVDTPVQTGKQQVQKAPVLDELTLDDILIAMRRAFSEGGPQEREDAIREVAYRLGFQRAGARIREAIADAFMKAVRRGVLIKDADIYSLAFRSYSECTRESLKDDFESAMGRGWISREDATRAFARWSGFGRVGDVINEHARSVINGLIREGRIETDGQDKIRRVKSDNRKN